MTALKFHATCQWCGQPKVANVHPTHGTSVACVEALKAELRKAEKASIDAIRAVAVQLAEVTEERDRLAADVAGADEAVDILVGQYREMRAERDAARERLDLVMAFRVEVDPEIFVTRLLKRDGSEDWGIRLWGRPSGHPLYLAGGEWRDWPGKTARDEGFTYPTAEDAFAALAAAREAGSVSTGAGGGPEAPQGNLDGKDGQSATERLGR